MTKIFAFYSDYMKTKITFWNHRQEQIFLYLEIAYFGYVTSDTKNSENQCKKLSILEDELRGEIFVVFGDFLIICKFLVCC